MKLLCFMNISLILNYFFPFFPLTLKVNKKCARRFLSFMVDFMAGGTWVPLANFWILGYLSAYNWVSVCKKLEYFTVETMVNHQVCLWPEI